MTVGRKLQISGKVQGVGFRYATLHKASELGVTGTVRNLADGRVEIVAQAKESTMNKFERWCRQGPSGSQVEDVTVADAPPGDHHEFRIIG